MPARPTDVTSPAVDVAKVASLAALVGVMIPLLILPLASIFLFGTSKGLDAFWSALTEPAALFSLKLSVATSTATTLFNLLFGLFAAYVLTKYSFPGRNTVTILISLPTAIPTAVVGFALLLLWGPYGLLGRYLVGTDIRVMFTTAAIILANVFVTFPLAFGTIKPVLESLDRVYEDAAETIGATRWQTFRHVTLPALRGALITGALLTFARSIGEFGSTILVSGNLTLRTQTAPLYIFTKFNEGDVEGANAVAIVLALLSFGIFSLIFLAKERFERR
ncbi:MAG: ABC transporter permease [Candidatus Latescibacteria bacterium]|nr:ABC transporter permease [Candidatus Latescibacterota bacterium]